MGIPERAPPRRRAARWRRVPKRPLPLPPPPPQLRFLSLSSAPQVADKHAATIQVHSGGATAAAAADIAQELDPGGDANHLMRGREEGWRIHRPPSPKKRASQGRDETREMRAVGWGRERASEVGRSGSAGGRRRAGGGL